MHLLVDDEHTATQEENCFLAELRSSKNVVGRGRDSKFHVESKITLTDLHFERLVI